MFHSSEQFLPLLTGYLLSMSPITTSSYHQNNKKRCFDRYTIMMENHGERCSSGALSSALQTSTITPSPINSSSSRPEVKKKKRAKHRNFPRPINAPEPSHDRRAEYVRSGNSVEQPPISTSNSSVAKISPYLKKLVFETYSKQRYN